MIEDAVATVAGIEELRSISWDGRSFVIVTVELDRDIDAAIQDVRDAVAGVVQPACRPESILRSSAKATSIHRRS